MTAVCGFSMEIMGMSSRALSLATVLLLIGFSAADTTLAQAQNLESGKTPSQLFAQTCNACHKSPRGLLKTVAPGSLPGFLRQHYTTSSDMASVLSSYLVSNGATDTRYQPKDGKDAKQKDGAKEGTREGTKEGTKEAARAPAEGARPHQRLPRSGETPDVMRPDVPAQAAIDKGKRGKKGRPEEPARTEPAAEPPQETAKREEGTKPSGEPAASEAKTEPAKTEPAKTEPAKTEPSNTESAKVEPSAGEAVVTRLDPVPAVTRAPATTAVAPATSTPAPAAAPGSPSTPPVQALDTPSAPSGEQPKPAVVEPKPPAVAAAPAPPTVPPAGPPAVPISQ
jgi:hypothetical protein